MPPFPPPPPPQIPIQTSREKRPVSFWQQSDVFLFPAEEEEEEEKKASPSFFPLRKSITHHATPWCFRLMGRGGMWWGRKHLITDPRCITICCFKKEFSFCVKMYVLSLWSYVPLRHCLSQYTWSLSISGRKSQTSCRQAHFKSWVRFVTVQKVLAACT